MSGLSELFHRSTDPQCQIEWRVCWMLNRIAYLLITILLQLTAMYGYKYLLQLNKATFHNVQLKAGTFI